MMEAVIVSVPNLIGSPTARVVITLGTLEHLQQLSAQQIAREVTDVLTRTESAIGDWLDKMRLNGAIERAGTSPLPTISNIPSCPGCGSSVEKRGDFCVACAMKKVGLGPEASIALVNQGEPPYKTRGNFRDAPTEREEMT